MDEVERLKDAKEQEHYDYLNNRKNLFHEHTLFDGFPVMGYSIDSVIEKMTEFRDQLAKRDVDMEKVEVAVFNDEDSDNLALTICWDEYETEEEYNSRIKLEIEHQQKQAEEQYQCIKNLVLENYETVLKIINEHSN